MNTFIVISSLCLVGGALCALVFVQAKRISRLQFELNVAERQVREQLSASGALRKNAKDGWEESRAWFARYTKAQEELTALQSNAVSSSKRWFEDLQAWERWAVLEGGMNLEGEPARVQRLLLSSDFQKLRCALAEYQRKEREAV